MVSSIKDLRIGPPLVNPCRPSQYTISRPGRTRRQSLWSCRVRHVHPAWLHRAFHSIERNMHAHYVRALAHALARARM